MEKDDENTTEAENEDQVDKEELRQMVMAVFGDMYSVNDAITIKKNENLVSKESFKIVNGNCRRIYIYGLFTNIRLNLMKLQIRFLNLYSFIVQNDCSDLLYDLINEINNTKSEIKNMNYLLLQIKKALIKLKIYNTPMCNKRISDLIACIYAKEELLLDELDDYFDKCKLATKGIRFISSNKNQEQLTEKNEIIDESVMVLGLKKKTSSD